MKKTYLRSAVVSMGFLAGTFIIEAQTGAGGGGAAGAGAAGAGQAAGQAGAAAGGTAAGRAAPSGGLNTVGGASIATPAAPAVGGASALQANPNTVGGAINNGGITAIPPGAGPSATLPTGVPGAAQSTPFNTLPSPVQSVLQGFSANGSLGSVTAVPGRAGTFRATVTQNGVPTELILGANGRVLSRAPITGSAATSPTGVSTDAAALGNVQAGIPLTSLPPAVRNSIQSQLRGAQVQSISRDELANGSLLRVTTLQNGVPTEMRFAANGALLGSTPLTGVSTSPFVPGATIIPGGPLALNALPNSVQSAVRNQLGDLQASRIMQQRMANGLAYVVTYDQNGRAMRMVVGPDGRILSNSPANVGAAAPATRATASSDIASTASADTNGATRTTEMKLDDLPEKIENVLKQNAPYAEVRTISREQRVGGDVYVVSVRDKDRAGEITIDANGRIIQDTRRDLSALTPRNPIPDEDKVEGMPYEKLPVAIQNAVKAYATASDIRSITLGLDRDGRTVYDVIFYRDGRRDRMIVRKDGSLSRIEEDVPAALKLPSDKPALIALGDLPRKVQDTVRRQTDNVRIKEIATREVAGQTVYSVKYNTNGAPVELLVNNEGTVILPEGGLNADRANAPIQAGVDPEEEEVVKVVDATTPSRSSAESAAGAAAARETGASVDAAIPAARTPSKMNFKDTPEPVQKTAKKIAGSGTIQSVSPKVGDGGVMYEVRYTQNGKIKTVTLDRNGVAQQPETTTSEP